jgi:hypothetical protein
MSQGIRALMAMAAGTRMSLLRNDPWPPPTPPAAHARPHPGDLLCIEAEIVPQHPGRLLRRHLGHQGDIIEHAGNIIEQGQQTGSGHIWHSFY